MRKVMRCRGRNRATGKTCGESLCETDDKFIYLQQPSGRKTVIQPLRPRSFSFICESCGYETFWEKQSENKF